MKVILLEGISSLGARGDVKEVSDGYAMNFLIPKGKALIATQYNINSLQFRKVKRLDDNTDYTKIIRTLNKQSISLNKKVSDKDNLFQAIHTKDIIQVVKSSFNLAIEDKWFKKTVNIKSIGSYSIDLVLPNSQTLTFSAIIEPVKK